MSFNLVLFLKFFNIFIKYLNFCSFLQIEILYENIEKLQKQNQIKTHPGIKDILKVEAIKNLI